MIAFRWLPLVCVVATLAGVGTGMGQETGNDALRERQVLDRATRLEQAGRPEEAMRVLEDLLAERVGSVSALLLLSQIAERSGEPRRALDPAENAFRLDDSGLPAVRQVWIRALRSAGLGDSARAVARSWVEEEPHEPAAYLEISALLASTGDQGAAVEALEAGRTAIGSDRLFVQELAALQAALGAYAEAATEWRAMLAWGEAGVQAVETRMRESGPRRADAQAAMKSELENGKATLPERKGGLALALRLGESAWAREIVTGLTRDLPPPGAREVLSDYEARARETGDLREAVWAAERLAEESESKDEALYWTSRAADQAFAAGDRKAALESFERLAEASAPGSDEYGLALRRLQELTADNDPEKAEEMAREHDALYPEDKQTSITMSARAAAAWMKKGNLTRARRALSVPSPETVAQAAVQAAVLGRLEFLSGRPGMARGHLELAGSVPAGRSGERLEALDLLAVVDAADSAGIADLGKGTLALMDSGDPRFLLDLVDRWSTERPAGGEVMTAFAARELELAGHREEARRARVAIVEFWPDSPAVPAALLDLARAELPDEPDAAAAWLERLIVGHPASAMAPLARRILAGLQSREPGA